MKLTIVVFMTGAAARAGMCWMEENVSIHAGQCKKETHRFEAHFILWTDHEIHPCTTARILTIANRPTTLCFAHR